MAEARGNLAADDQDIAGFGTLRTGSSVHLNFQERLVFVADVLQVQFLPMLPSPPTRQWLLKV
jgi:hypothetical protein